MSAQHDPALEPILANPIRLALWRESTERKGPGLLAIADAFLTAANADGGTFTPKSAWQLVHALTATRAGLAVLPRWVAEAFAEVLHLDPSDLRPEGAPPLLRAVPHSERKMACPTPSPSRPSASPASATPAGKVSARTAKGTAASANTTSAKTGPQGNHDELASAGATGTHPPVATPPASPANWRQSARCSGMDTNIFYPEQGGPCSEAKAVCFACPLDARGRCLREALERVEPYGIWGGTSERQRRKLKQHQNLSNTELLALADRISGGPEREPKRPKPALPEEAALAGGEKRCRECWQVKPVSEFSPHRGHRDNLHCYCKKCAAARSREYSYGLSPEIRARRREERRAS